MDNYIYSYYRSYIRTYFYEATFLKRPLNGNYMNVGGKRYRSLWFDPGSPGKVHSIDQRKLPFELSVESLSTVEQVCTAIRDMHLRGAPLIGVAAAFGLYLAACRLKGNKDPLQQLQQAAENLVSTRPTAVNLKAAVDRQMNRIGGVQETNELRDILLQGAEALWEEELENCRQIGWQGLRLIEEFCAKQGKQEINILTHCNAGWLACIDYGTATAPIYMAHDRGMKVHVWVDETRPRNQGARLTAWELGQHGVDHTIIADNTGGYLMQQGKVDMVIVGSDRTTAAGDVANKIGTYLKALAAKDNGIPFYVALPSTSIDWTIHDGLAEIPIEKRSANEVHYMEGMDGAMLRNVRITPTESKAQNYGFDVTPARLITALITEKGICPASAKGLQTLFQRQ